MNIQVSASENAFLGTRRLPSSVDAVRRRMVTSQVGSCICLLERGDDRQDNKALFELSEIKYLRNLRFCIL